MSLAAPRLLFVDLRKGLCRYEALPARWQGLGGRALAAAASVSFTPPDASPLGPDNALVFAPGLLAGTRCANSGRISLAFKSPLTGRLHATNAGGGAAAAFARLGIAALIVEGQAPPGVLLRLDATFDGAVLSPALAFGTDLAGLGARETVAALLRGGSDAIACAVVSGAGELGLAASGVAFGSGGDEKDRLRFALRGGGGAVMGAKGLKAVVTKTSGASPSPDEARPGSVALAAASRRFAAAVAKRGKNAEAGKTGACAGCVIACPASGNGGSKRKQPGANEGGRLAAWDKWPGFGELWAPESREECASLSAEYGALCDDLVLDGLEVARALGVFLQAGKLRAKDARGALDLLRAARDGTALGRVLGNGAVAAAALFGVSAPPSVCGPHEKQDSEICAEDRRIVNASMDSLGICRFAAQTALSDPEAAQALAEVASVATGRVVDMGDIVAMGKAAVAREEEFNAAAASARV